jgi:hypothetical protein
MPADTNYSQILEKLADSHQERLANALSTLEDNVAKLMDSAPTKDGKLFDLEWAVSARPELQAALQADYLAEVDSAIRDYSKVAADASKMLSSYGDFTKLDSTVISQLQRLSFQGFQGIANEYLDVLANEVYQSTLTGRAFNDTVKNLRQTINGVYIQSDSVEANRLVDVAANGTAAQKADAVRQLQTVYARDRVGNNLRRYSTQMAQDSLMQFDASINTAIGKESGATKWKYYGSTVRDSRPFCVEHAGQVFTEEEITDTWAGSWKGKSSGDPYIVRGGYNCRHHWRPVFDAEADNIAAETKQEKPSASIPLGLPALSKKKDLTNDFDKRTEVVNLKGSTLLNKSSSTGYVIESNGEFATRFNQGWTRRSGLSYKEFNQKVINNNDLKAFSAETLSLIKPTIEAVDKLAKTIGVPKIRTIGPSKSKAVADMGDGALGLNKGIYNGYGKKAYTDNGELIVAELKAQQKVEELQELGQRQYQRYLELRPQAGSAPLSGTLADEYFASIEAYNKNLKAIKAAEKKLAAATKAARPSIASTYVKGGNKADRPFSASGYFADNADLGKATIFHEFGHNVHQQYFATRLNLRNPPLEKWLKSKFTKKSFYPTKYSETNPQEWFAENFALYNMGRKDLVDSDIKDLLDAMLESKGRLKVHNGFNFETGEYGGG